MKSADYTAGFLIFTSLHNIIMVSNIDDISKPKYT
jgi:hypothetical protein